MFQNEAELEKEQEKGPSAEADGPSEFQGREEISGDHHRHHHGRHH